VSTRGRKADLKAVDGGLAGVPRAPDAVPATLHGEWNDICADMVKRKILTSAALGLLESYLIARWTVREAQAAIAKHGVLIEAATYDACAGEIDLDQLENDETPCWLGVDLSSSIDLSVIIAAWPMEDGSVVVQPWFFCPADNLRDRQDISLAPYVRWAEEGLITATPGATIDRRVVEQQIREIHARFNVQEIACDPALAQTTLSNLVDEGLPAVEMRQGALTMMPALAELERAVIGGTFRHDGHPVLRWTFANAEVQRNTMGHLVRLKKPKLWLSIDGAVAAAMAVGRAAQGNSNRSSYDDAPDDVEEWAYA
jgi:phage terminase large subunit-like protein